MLRGWGLEASLEGLASHNAQPFFILTLFLFFRSCSESRSDEVSEISTATCGFAVRAAHDDTCAPHCGADVGANLGEGGGGGGGGEGGRGDGDDESIFFSGVDAIDFTLSRSLIQGSVPTHTHSLSLHEAIHAVPTHTYT